MNFLELIRGSGWLQYLNAASGSEPFNCYYPIPDPLCLRYFLAVMIAMSIIIVRAIITSTSRTTTPTAIAIVYIPGELAVEKIKGLHKFVGSCVHWQPINILQLVDPNLSCLYDCK